MKILKKLISINIIFTLFAAAAFSEGFFSGYAGGKLNYSADTSAETYDPDLKLQAFVQGQFNFSRNLWSRFEFSIDSGDFISENLFHETDSKFKIDELSLVARATVEQSANYFSVYMGTFDPIGSDVFLQRYFSMRPIASKITESWLGLSGSILYPHFGFGISDVIRFYNQPLALGLYAYINHEDDTYFTDDKYFVFNTDLRFAGAYRYLAWDFAAGLGAPLIDKYKGTDVIFAVNKLYWHAGTTILVGNNYTQSLFMQAGIFNATFSKSAITIPSKNSIYLLVEPRFKIATTHVNLTVYSLPKATVDQLLFVEDTLGVNLNVYSEALLIGNQRFTIGTNFSYSFPDKTFMDLKAPLELVQGDFNVNVTPYISTNLLNGQLHAQTTVKIMEFTRSQWYNAITADIGYKVNF